MRVEWLAVAHAVVPWIDGLDNRWTVAGDTQYSYRYEEHPGAACEPLGFVDLATRPGLGRERCVDKCSEGALCSGRAGAPCYCTGFQPKVAASDDLALCLPADKLQAACDAEPSCTQILIPSYHRGFLVTGCTPPQKQRAALPTAAVLKKARRPTPGCSLGYGVELLGGYPEAQGIYKGLGERTYGQVGGEHRVIWRDCGWVVQSGAWMPRRAPEPSPCADDVAAANWAFAQVGEAYDAGVCAAAAWEASYCVSALFSRLCPASCGLSAEECAGDDDRAIGELLAAVYNCRQDCNCANPAVNCDDPVSRAACPATCSEPAPMAYLGDTQSADAESVSLTPKLPRGLVSWGDELRSFLAAAPRRLLAGSWEDVYATFEQVDYRACTEASPTLQTDVVQYYYGPTSGGDATALLASAESGYYYSDAVVEAGNTTPAPPMPYWSEAAVGGYYTSTKTAAPVLTPAETAKALNMTVHDAAYEVYPALVDPLYSESGELAKSLYDIRKFNSPIPGMRWSHHCPLYTTARTFPKMVSTAPFLPPPRDGCLEKCFLFVNVTVNVTNFSGVKNTTLPMTTPAPEGYTGPTAYVFRSKEGDVLMQELTYCDGAVGGLDNKSSVCLPRDECEELCAETEGCSSISVHRYLPHCYLHGISGPDDFPLREDHPDFDLVLDVPDRERFETVSYSVAMNCTTMGPTMVYNVSIGPDSINRTLCEQFCSDYDCDQLQLKTWPNGTLYSCQVLHGCESLQLAFPYRTCIRKEYVENATVEICGDPEPPDGAYYYFGSVFPEEKPLFPGPPPEPEEKMVVERPVYVEADRRLQDGNAYGYAYGSILPTPAPTPCPNGTMMHNGTCFNITFCRNVSVPETHHIDNCVDGDNFMQTIIYRRAPKPCEVDVATNGTETVMVPNMTLVQSSLARDATYFTFDNRTRLVWRTNPGEFCPVGWSLESNLAVEYEMLANCSDQPDAANMHIYGQEKQHYRRFVCELWATKGRCATDVIFSAICAFSCTDLSTTSIDGITYTHQSTLNCTGDNDTAAVEFAMSFHAMRGVEPGVVRDCGDAHALLTDIPGTMSSNESAEACFTFTWTPIFRAICPETCAAKLPIPEPDLLPVMPNISLEDEPAGAEDHIPFKKWYERRLAATAEMAVPRAPRESSSWKPVARTWHPFGTCPSFDSPDTGKLWRWVPPLDPTVSISYVCQDSPLCPVFTTCALTAGHFADESARLRAGANPKRFIGALPIAPRQSFIASFRPTAILSEARVESYAHHASWHLGQELMRRAPGAPRVRFVGWQAADAVYSVVVMVSPMTNAGLLALAELGRKYVAPKGYQPLKTDVIRIELLTGAAVPVSPPASVTMDLYAPTTRRLRLLQFSGESALGTDVEDLGATVEALGDGWFRATVAPNFDYAGTEDAYECAEDNGGCDEHATCTEVLAGPPKCTCRAPWVGDGITCAPGLEVLNAGETLLRITHTAKLYTGWTVREVTLFNDTTCSAPLTWDHATGLAYPTATSATAFPGFDAAALLDGRPTAWRSLCLHCDPDSEEAEAGAVTIEIKVPGEFDVGCVRVEQDPPSTPLRVERRVAAGVVGVYAAPAGANTFATMPCGTPGVQIFGEMITVPGTSSPLSKDGPSYHTARNPCDCLMRCVANREAGCRTWRFFAPTQACILQRPPFGPGAGFYGTAEAAIPPKPEPIGTYYYSRPDADPQEFWTSGYVPTEVLGFAAEPARPASGAPFSVSVLGVNLPTVDDDDLPISQAQRVKIVASGASCATAPIGHGCDAVTHERDTPHGPVAEQVYTICGPPPAKASDSFVSFDGFSLPPGVVDMTFDVCYCAGMDCHRPTMWSKVPGELASVASTFTWSTDPETVYRFMPESGQKFSLSIYRPAFSTFSHVYEWGLKLVVKPFDCRADPATSLSFHVDEKLSSHDVKVWEVELLFFESADYLVCFTEDGKMWAPIPHAKGGLYLSTKSLPADASRPRGFLSATQRLSASLIAPSTVSVAGERLTVAGLDATLGIGPSCSGDLQVFPATAYAASAITFDLDPHVLRLLTAGEYRACICDSTAFKVPVSRNGTWYLPESECVERSPALPVASILPEWSAHLCSAKCPNCVGDECWCDAAAEAGSLCLPPDLCREACDDHGACAGFVTREGGTACTLLESNGNFTKGREIPNLVQFRKMEGSPCGAELSVADRAVAERRVFDRADTFPDGVLSTDELKAVYGKDLAKIPADFATFQAKADVDGDRRVSFGEYVKVLGRYRDIGPFILTGKAHVGVTYVLPPGQPAALEVSGGNLSDVLGVSKDRVMVIDSDAQCGADEPAKTVMEPTDWEDWSPQAVAVPVHAPGHGGGVEEIEWSIVQGYFCPSSNLKVNDFPMLRAHQCHRKCSKKCFSNATFQCHCGGYYDCTGEGCDTEDSNALCADEVLCRNLASGVYGIVRSFDLHQGRPRCFLNDVRLEAGCAHPVQPSALVESLDYALHVAKPPPELTFALNPRASTPTLLRFEPLVLRTPGTFKACFCDSLHFDCLQRSSYGVTLGEIHVSGVGCLLSAGKHSGECAQQAAGGLRCYAGPAPVEGVGAVEEHFEERDVGKDFCLYGPEEETLRDPRCRPVGPYPTPAPTPSPVPVWVDGDPLGDSLAGPGSLTR